MSTPKKKSNQHKKVSFLYVWSISFLLVLISAVVFLLPRVLSNDPCFDDWDIVCTTAPKWLQILDSFGLIIVVATYYIVLPIFIALTIIIGARWIHQKLKRRAKNSK